jgi:hypothetical protein
MSLWGAIAGMFQPARELVEVFKTNAENQAERSHEERMELSRQDLAALEQFAAEFKSARTSTAWDSFIDGLNRLPRPLITLGILGLFVLAPADPVRFLAIAEAYQLMPDGFWALLSIIIAFYFGGRMQVTRQQMSIKGGALDAAKEIVKAKKAFRDLAEDDEPSPGKAIREPETTASPDQRGNAVVAAWLQRRDARSAETIAP